MIHEYIQPSAKPNKQAEGYTIEEPYSQLSKFRAENNTPSTVLYSMPFPDSDISNKYKPSYEKQVYDLAPFDIKPSSKGKKPKVPASSNTDVKPKGLNRNFDSYNVQQRERRYLRDRRRKKHGLL